MKWDDLFPDGTNGCLRGKRLRVSYELVEKSPCVRKYVYASADRFHRCT